MLIDLTLSVDTALLDNISSTERMVRWGHLGTHFDGMDTEFSLEYWRLKGKLFDVRGYEDGIIGIGDIDPSVIEKGDFVIFYTGFLENQEYGSSIYFNDHPQLSYELIDLLLEKEVKIIGIDAAGLRRGEEHTPVDQRCADRGVFVVENIANLKSLNNAAGKKQFTVYTSPVNFKGMTGLPCRVIAEVA